MDRLGDLEEAMKRREPEADARASADSESEVASLVPPLAATSSVCTPPAVPLRYTRGVCSS